jgi:hypothetical protein
MVTVEQFYDVSIKFLLKPLSSANLWDRLNEKCYKGGWMMVGKDIFSCSWDEFEGSLDQKTNQWGFFVEDTTHRFQAIPRIYC